jgi:tetratricopeptide (TPR) repeat protein
MRLSKPLFPLQPPWQRLLRLGGCIVLASSLFSIPRVVATPSPNPSPKPSPGFTPKPLSESEIKANQSFATAQRLFTGGKFREAAEQLEITTKNNGKFIPAFYMLGIAKYQLGDYAAAEKAFVQTTSIDSRYYMGYVQAAGAALAQGHYDDAKRHASAIEKFDKKSFLLTYALGVIAYTEGKAHEAATLFERSRLAYDEYPPTLYNLAVALYNDHAVTRALPRIRQACLIETKKPLYHFMQGWMMFMSRDTGGGYTAFRRVLELDRGAYAATARGLEALQSQKLDDALREAQEAIRINPDLVKAWVLKGLSLARQQHRNEARDALLEALAIDPCDVDAREGLGRMGCNPPAPGPARLPHPATSPQGSSSPSPSQEPTASPRPTQSSATKPASSTSGTHPTKPAPAPPPPQVMPPPGVPLPPSR